MKVRLALAAALAFLVSACAQISGVLDGREEADAQQFLPDGGPPVVNGYYEVSESCSAGYCRDARAMSSLTLLEQPHPESAVIAVAPEGEWLSNLSSVYRVRPRRGVVQQAIETEWPSGVVVRFEAGDVVHNIDFSFDTDTDTDTDTDEPAEGVTLWFRGALVYYAGFQEDSGVISWEQPRGDDGAANGRWFQVRRDNGQVGFVRDGFLGCHDGMDHGGLCDGGRALEALDCEAFDNQYLCHLRRSRAEPSATSYPTPSPFRDCADCPSMVRIPGRSFAAGQYEVTFDEWDACVAAGGCNGYSPDDSGWGRGNRPVMNVKWEDAQAYVRWLRQRTGRRYRLLTTDEWTAAAFPGGRRQLYHWGNEEPVCEPGARNGVAFNHCMPQRTMPVGSFQPNAFGLHDTLGNVGEWLQDPYEPGREHVYAKIGGSWASSPESLGGRGGGRAENFGHDTGFRVARRR